MSANYFSFYGVALMHWRKHKRCPPTIYATYRCAGKFPSECCIHKACQIQGHYGKRTLIHFIHLSLSRNEAYNFWLLLTKPSTADTLRGIRAADKVVARSASVRDRSSVLAVRVEDNAVCARRACGRKLALLPCPYTLRNRGLTTSVNSARLDRELLPRAADAEVEAFVVVVAVRVVAAADLLSVLEVVAALVDGRGHLGC